MDTYTKNVRLQKAESQQHQQQQSKLILNDGYDPIIQEQIRNHLNDNTRQIIKIKICIIIVVSKYDNNIENYYHVSLSLPYYYNV